MNTYCTIMYNDFFYFDKACYDCPWRGVKDCFRPHCVAADGYERGITTVNRSSYYTPPSLYLFPQHNTFYILPFQGIPNFNFRTMPGPPVVVCQGDEMLVEVHNKLHTQGTSIHFHGN